MTESIFVRVQRVLSTGVESAAEALERVSGTSLMREAIRQVDRAADDILAEREAAKTRRLHAARQHQITRERLATLSEQARFAMSKGREDLAQTAVARQIDYEAQADQLKKVQAEAAEEEGRLAECLAALKIRKAQMEKELAAFQAAQRGTSCTGAATRPTPIDRTEHKVARAEAAFERAMNAAGAAVGLMDAGEAAKLSEVDALRKDDQVAERLAALRAAQAAGGGARKRPPKAAKAR